MLKEAYARWLLDTEAADKAADEATAQSTQVSLEQVIQFHLDHVKDEGAANAYPQHVRSAGDRMDDDRKRAGGASIAKSHEGGDYPLQFDLCR